MTTLEIIEQYGNTHLIIDGRIALISPGPVKEEALLFGLTLDQIAAVLDQASQILQQQITPETRGDCLSGGQQIVVAILLALASSAEKILYIHVFEALDAERREQLQKLFTTEPRGRVSYMFGSNKVGLWE